MVLRYFALGAVILAGICVGHVGYLYSHPEFNPDEFAHSIACENVIDIPEPTLEAKQQVSQLLRQKFYYLGRGKQMTAYESEDHCYVIKFFNPRQPLKEKWFQSFSRIKRLCSLKWLNSAYFKREARLKRLFSRYQMAHQELREEAGLVYVHLNPVTALDQQIEIQGKEGKTYSVKVKNVPFVLQKKGMLAKPYIESFLARGDQEGAKQAISALKAFFAARAQKGFTDRLQALRKNYAFVEGKVIQIDLGRIKRDETLKASPQQELARIFTSIDAGFPVID